MKNTIYKIGYLLFALVIISACESPEAETNYTPAEYELPSVVTLNSGTITNSSIQFSIDIPGTGKGYYVIVESGSEAPSNNDVFAGSAAGLLDSGSFDIGGSNSFEVNTGLCDGTSYDVYAVHLSSDSFLSDTTASLTLTTSANANIAGTYDTVTNGVLSGNFGGEAVNYAGVVTITDNGDGTFTFDDTTAGIYPDPNYYGSFGSPPVPYTFEVPCNEIVGQFFSPFYGCCDDWIDFQGVINNDGTITVHWESAFGEVMDVVYTKQ